jgi:hypothetical protein
VFGWLKRRWQAEREAEARSLAIGREMDRRSAEMRSAGPTLISRHIPAAEAGRAVTVSLKAGDDGAFVAEMDMDSGQVGLHRAAPPIATTVSDAGHWALAGRCEHAEEIEVITQRGERVEVSYGDGAWMAIIQPLDEDLAVDVWTTSNGRREGKQTVTLHRLEAPPIETRGWGPFRHVVSAGSAVGWTRFDPAD